MEGYLAENKGFWEHGYHAPNVDHPVFRFYGRILKPDFGVSGKEGETLLDYGCGQGSAVNYFAKLGFDAYGVDISETDIGFAKNLYPDIKDNFEVIPAAPNVADFCFGKSFRVITAIQSLYYYSDTDLALRMETLYASMEPGGVFYATMIGEQCTAHFENTEPVGDGLRRIGSSSSRSGEGCHYMNFIKDEDELKKKFEMFKPVHIGFYSDQFRSDEGVSFHYTFVGTK